MLLVLGALATLLAVLGTVGLAVAAAGDTSTMANVAGGLAFWWILAVVLVVPGILLLRRPERR